MSTTILFDDDTDVDMTLATTSVLFGYMTPNGWTFRGSLGVIVDGTLTDVGALGTTYDVQTGGSMGLGATKQWNVGQHFVAASLDLSGSRTKTHRPNLADVTFSAVDVRLGATAGTVIADRLYPYALVRVFGGPVFWQRGNDEVVGADKYHYQLGIGTSVKLVTSIRAFVDVAVLGEKALSVGLSYSL